MRASAGLTFRMRPSRDALNTPIGERSNQSCIGTSAATASHYPVGMRPPQGSRIRSEQQRVLDVVERAGAPARERAAAREKILGLGEHGAQIDEPAVGIERRARPDLLGQ